MKKRFLFILTINLTAVFLFLVVQYNFHLLDRLEYSATDFFFRLRSVRPPSTDIAIITVDQASIEEMGRYPWSRERHAQLIRLLTKAGAKAIAFDILFTEKDDINPQDDVYLGDVAAKSGRTIVAMYFNKTQGGLPAEPLLPIDPLQRPGIEMGFVNTFHETDGVVRQMPLWVEYNGTLVPSLSLAAYSKAMNTTPEELVPHLRPFTNGPWSEVFLNFTGWYDDTNVSPSPFPYYSYVDVLRGRKDASIFKNKIVLVGGTASGLFDFKSVPNRTNFPGIEIHANALNGLIRRNFLRPVNPIWMIQIMILSGLLLGFYLLRSSSWTGALISIVTFFAYALFCIIALSSQALLFKFWVPMTVFFIIFVITLSYGLIMGQEETKRIQEKWSRYMSPKLVDILVNDRVVPKEGNLEVTVFFSDIANFTGLSESVQPRQLVEVLNAYFSFMTNILLKHDATFDKYIGDCIMAYWNAPVEQPAHAVTACHAALEQVNSLAEMNKQFSLRGWPRLDFRIGMNTGNVLFGDLGSYLQSNYTIMGDAVNLASRLEAVNKMFGTRILISESTYAAAREEIEARELDWLRVKGKQQPVRVYELVARKNAVSVEKRKAFDTFKEGLKFYRDKRFEEALAQFMSALVALPEDKATVTYIKRCELFLASPPPREWDGVFVMTEK